MNSPLRNITTGAMWLLFATVGLSLVYLLAGVDARAQIAEWLVASAGNTWREHRFWTLATSPTLEPAVLSLILQAMVIVMLMPSIERIWGTPRFLRFAGAASLAGTLGGTLAGIALGRDTSITGLDPMIYASFVVVGREFARQPVQLFGAIPLTGRQVMFGLLGFVTLLVVLDQDWVMGAAYASAILVAVWFTSDRFAPEALWYRVRKKPKPFTVIHGGSRQVRPRSDSQWLN